MNGRQTLAKRFLEHGFSRVALAFALVMVLLATNLPGVGITYDTTEYFAGAKSIAEAGTFAAVDGRAQATWPPGYSFLISIPYQFGFSLEVSSLLITAASLLIIVIACHKLLRAVGLSAKASAGGVGLLLISPGYVQASSVALSELPFVAALLSSVAILQMRKRTSFLFLAGAFLGFAGLIRYVGVFFAPFLLLLAMISQKEVPTKRRVVSRALVFLTAAIPLPLLWIQRNIRLTGFATGSREPGGGTFISAIKLAIEAFSQTVTGSSDSVFRLVSLSVGIVLLASLCLAGVLAMRNRRFEVAIFALVPVAYLVFTAYRFVVVEYAPIDLRAMVPVTPFALVALAGAPWPRPLHAHRLNWLVSLTIPLFVMGLVNLGLRSREAEAWGSAKFQESNFAQAVEALPKDSLFISNFPQRAFSLTEGIPIRNQYQFDLPPVENCERRFGLWFAEAPFQGNEPKLASVLFSDEEGSIFDLGNCSTPAKSFWE
jgi:hypothetical protein